MKTIIAQLFLPVFFFTACQAGDTTERLRSAITVRQFALGQTIISVRQSTYGTDAPFLFVHLHSNETTAIKAVQRMGSEWGIPLIQLSNKKSRLVPFQLNSQTFRFDPNRIFSDEGLRKTLRRSGRYTDAAFREVQRFRDSLLSLLLTGKPLVAVHNNTDRRFSILQYRDAGSGQVHLNATQDTDDFFITNDETIYTRLKQENVNVVLEDVSQLEEDGSLSLYCSRQGIPYINVEAQHGHLTRQLQMLETVYQILK